MPGRHVTDHQMRLFMKHRTTDPIPVAAARAGFSAATGYRIAQEQRLPSEKRVPRTGPGGNSLRRLAWVGEEDGDRPYPTPNFAPELSPQKLRPLH